MFVQAALLVVLAVALAGPCSRGLAYARWPARYPAAALLLWQGIGLSGGLALLTSELTLAAANLGGPWPAAVPHALSDPAELTVLGWAGLLAFGATALWLLGVLIGSAIRVAAARRHHRYLLDMLALQTRHDAPEDVYVLNHSANAAYSIPGLRSRIVVSQGACDHLSAAQLLAVIEHERAHLRQHHDVVVQPFVAWRKSFPFLATATGALRAVEILTEYLADDAASDRAGRDALLDALASMGKTPTLIARQRRLSAHRTV